jgi:hypothetical protein
VSLALLYTLLNALKPLVIDDAAYYYYAVQAAAKPLDPYGFTVFWWERPDPANYVLAPMGLPYWWSLGLRLFGDRPFLWKLWLLPYSILFVASLYSLFRRYTGKYEVTLVAFTVFSPAFLPSLNLMLDVPAIALGLAAIVVYLRAADRDSWQLAFGAGILAGLAMETKYTGFLTPAAMLLHAVIYRRFRLGLVAAGTAGLLFTAWEMFLAWQYGDSHFLWHVRANKDALLKKAHLILPLFGNLGSLCLAGTLLALAALRCPRWLLLVAGITSALAYVTVALVGGVFESWFTFPLFADPGQTFVGMWWLEDGIFIPLGVFVGGVCALMCWRLFFRRGLQRRVVRREWLFLVLWLGLEVAGYFALTPFAAVRRLLGVTVVGGLLIGTLAARTCRRRPGLVSGITAYGVVLGLGFYSVDLLEAFAEKNAAEQAAAFIHARDERPTIWYVGHWGFQHYAERNGMKPVVPRSNGPQPDDSVLRPGDWIVVPDEGVTQQSFRVDDEHAELMGKLELNDGIPLRTVICFYSGRTAVTHLDGARLVVRIYRVKDEHTARSH